MRPRVTREQLWTLDEGWHQSDLLEPDLMRLASNDVDPIGHAEPQRAG
jgi:hypothetical protein